ncbi:hypothetical protein SAMN02745121_07093 [Nannocystis exedens]|uniref:Uncharacterized protein n=1 Tax=Nannocystis exedens TaxID=54 RepID=A0A1I2G7A6_9BACT|nr:hypothetical protein [Nannocystis exedens]PCC67260.1 hypothetical protein NAEX_00263 [Nannocystis exedens]SFF13039.1 hypothetical protein SAMN02745121_07093 [Nannocystis exedens]
MTRDLGEFCARFVAPLLGGGTVHVAAPVRPADFRAMAGELATLRASEVAALRLQRAQQLVAEPDLHEPGAEELALWVALYNLLVLDHPDRGRVWARQATWRRVESAARYWLLFSRPEGFSAALANHAAVGAFLELSRRDQILSGAEGELRFVGQEIPRRRLRWTVPGALSVREETINWWSTAHAPEVSALQQDVLWASPVTCLLRPLMAPPGYSPLEGAGFLRHRAFARAVCHAWASSRHWIEIGGTVLGSLLFSLTGRPLSGPTPTAGATGAQSAGARPMLALPAPADSAGPEDVAALVAALIHVHFLRVLELGARLGVAPTSRDRPVQMFLALPLLLPALGEVLGSPLGGPASVGFDAQVERRWIEYIDHLGELIPRSVVENLLATLVPRVVKAEK